MRFRPMASAFAATLLAACASPPPHEPPQAPRPQTVVAVTADGALIQFNAGTPRQIEARHRITGLAVGEQLVGIDYRVARGVLYGLGSTGRLYTLDAASGAAKPVGSAPPAPLVGQRFGFDFNPAADRIRVVSDRGLNLRLHPDTGALAATDPVLTAGNTAAPVANIVAAAYTYSQQDEKLTTNYAIDTARGALLTQGTVEGRKPPVSPNSGQLYDVGALGTGPLDDADFDIADIDNTALAALRQADRTRLYLLDLTTGRATLLGTVGDGRPLVGIAIAP